MKNSSCNRKGVFAIIVAYNPNLINILRLISILNHQVEKIIVVDNGSANCSELRAGCATAENIEIIAFDKNFGIAYAQNCGIDFARNAKAEYLIFFDQDSTIKEDFVFLLKNYFLKLSESSKVAVVAPIFKDEKKGFFYPLIRLRKFGLRRRITPDGSENFPIQVSFVISSGTFTSMAVVNEVGNMHSDFFIDYVDIEWCLRAAHAGYSLFAVPAVSMMHSIGDRSILFIRWRLAIHSEWRRYYRIRNSFFLYHFSHVPKILALREIFVNIIHQFILIATQKNKKKQIKYLMSGILDGIRFK
ncbi:glycosyltransferase family 2 protein [Janthinobacterium aquaticum]|uniref:glycosyltransferase family 2 protein n=1 Tax=Janthinobacterium sp. FT58W TaxID=2654254 RepID=UPI001264AC8F|nr:glycosyltransferase family 2 protein [Janthinobacterium sp. FT58W]KAB8043345.1 rhamnosyltransferase [Janthinobacterium sp. FT58W]